MSTSVVRYGTALPEELIERLRARAVADDVPQTTIIRAALRMFLGDERTLDGKGHTESQHGS
jgi:hypothetical protein